MKCGLINEIGHKIMKKKNNNNNKHIQLFLYFPCNAYATLRSTSIYDLLVTLHKNKKLSHSINDFFI